MTAFTAPVALPALVEQVGLPVVVQGVPTASLPVQQLPTVSLPVEPLVVIAFALLVGGVLGSVLPFLPGGFLSLVGVVTYWFANGYDEPGLLVLSGLTFVALLAMAVEWLAGAVSAKAGGASTRTTVAATVAGFVGLLAFGPLGFLLGTAGTVFALTFVENEDVEESLRTAGVTLVGMLTSNVVQLLLTGGILVVMVLVAVL